MHALLVAYRGYFSEEKARNLGEVKSEFIGHVFRIGLSILKRLTVPRLAISACIFFDV